MLDLRASSGTTLGICTISNQFLSVTLSPSVTLYKDVEIPFRQVFPPLYLHETKSNICLMKVSLMRETFIITFLEIPLVSLIFILTPMLNHVTMRLDVLHSHNRITYQYLRDSTQWYNRSYCSFRDF